MSENRGIAPTSPDEFSRFAEKYPYHAIHDVDAYQRPMLEVTVDSLKINCIVDTGADFVTMPFEHFRGRGYHLDEKSPVDIGTAAKGQSVRAYPLRNSHGKAPPIARLGRFYFHKPIAIYCSEEFRANILGRTSILPEYAFLFECHRFHVFATGEKKPPMIKAQAGGPFLRI
ncbi:MAG: hypothetical protein ABJF10_09575 [Chthoniobacter sp.]|uniref:hypothetical protein n=1 Tax=Chthoniobacter sp. TaxID=2510640 RepID=UPI0032AD86AE